MNRGLIIPFSKHCCPSCGRSMRFVLSVPRFGGFPELHTYECKTCGVSFTEAAKQNDKAVTREEA